MLLRPHSRRLLVGSVATLAAAAILGLVLLRRPASPQGDDDAVSADAGAPAETLPWSRPELLSQVATVDTARSAGAQFPTLPSPLVARRAQPEAMDDPSADGWSTEVLQENIGKSLQSLLHLVETPGDLDPSHLEPWLDTDFTCTPLRPRSTEEVWRHASLRVLRAKAGKLPEKPRRRGAFGLAAELRALLQIGPGPLRAHKKIFRIEAGAQSAVTHVYVDFHARGTSRSFEHNATWECHWSLDKAGSPPRLSRLVVLDFEEVSGPPAPLFADCTESVLGEDATLRAQILPGIQHWLRRTDISVEPDFEGMQGMALGDVDGDGLEDLYLCAGGGLPNRLLRHEADGTLTDISAGSGADFLETSRGALLVDFDGDGDADLAVATDAALLLLENEGKGHFRERARFADLTLGFSLAAADFDQDADLDLYVSRHFSESHKMVGQLPSPVPYHDANNGGRNALLRNDGDWTFVDATVTSGLDANNRRWSYAVAWEDYDNDGDLDLYVANDFGRNNLYRNDGGRFTDVAAAAGVEDVASGMSVTWGDMDQDGDMDLYVSNMFSSAGGRITFQRRFQTRASKETKQMYQRLARGNSLFENMGDGTFRDVSDEAAVTMGRWAWASRFIDLDNDGREDLVVANGYITGSKLDDL